MRKRFNEARGSYIFFWILVILAIYYSFVGGISSFVGSGLAGGLGTGNGNIFIVGQITNIKALILFLFAFLVWELQIK